MWVRQLGEVLAVGVQQLEAEQTYRHVLHGLGDAVFASPEHDLLKRAQLPGGRVEGNDLSLQDRLARGKPLLERLDDVRELVTDALQPAGEQLDSAVCRAVCLDPHTVVLVLGRAFAAQFGQDLDGVGQPLGEHDPHRVAGAHLDSFDRRQSAAGECRSNQAEVTADVVRALQHRPGGTATGVDERESVQDGRGSDSQPEAAGHQTQQVASLQWGGQRADRPAAPACGPASPALRPGRSGAACRPPPPPVGWPAGHQQ